MKRLRHLLFTLLVIGIISLVQCGTIDETTLTVVDYTLTGNAAQVAGGIQLTQDANGQMARVLYKNPQDVSLGFSITIYFEVSGSGPSYGEAFGLVVSGDKNSFLNAQQSNGGAWNLVYMSNMVAFGVDMVFGRVYFCQVNNTAELPPIYLATNECIFKTYSSLGVGNHTMRIDYVPNGVDTSWTMKLDGIQNIFNPGPSVITPTTLNQYYFGWTASTGSIFSDRTLQGWTASIEEPCVTNNGGCSADATCSYIGNGQINCTCNTGFQGTGIICDPIPPTPPVAPPVAPPVNAPIASPISAPITPPIAPPVVAPISPPIAPPVDTPIEAIVDAPKAPGPEVLVPAIVIPVVGVAAALFFGIYFGKKAQAKKKENEQKASGDVESSEGAVEMTRASAGSATGIAPSNYATVPAMSRVSGQYNSIPELEGAETSDVGVSEINPIGINPSDIDKRMHIPYKSLVFTKEIGAGSYGKVFLGEWRGAEVAIKVNNTVTDMDGFLAEAKLTLGIAPHPNLVQTFGVSLDGAYPCIVLEFCGGGSLDKIVFDNASTITDAKRKEFALKIAYGLIHLHNNSIVHRDLAARNILLSTEGQPKVSDFGMSRVIKDEEAKGKTKTNIGPLRWMSPENLADNTYSVKSDVWSYGILVWEIVVGQEPHKDEDQLRIGVKIRDEAFHPAIPDDCDPTLRQVMEMCWQKDPADRPTMEEISKYLRKN